MKLALQISRPGVPAPVASKLLPNSPNRGTAVSAPLCSCEMRAASSCTAQIRCPSSFLPSLTADPARVRAHCGSIAPCPWATSADRHSHEECKIHTDPGGTAGPGSRLGAKNVPNAGRPSAGSASCAGARRPGRLTVESLYRSPCERPRRSPGRVESLGREGRSCRCHPVPQ